MATFAQGLLLALFIWKLLITCQTYPRTEAKLPLCYTRDALLSLRSTGTTPPVDLPEVVRAQPASSRKRRRGIRGAIRQRLRWSRPPLPGMILSNARSLRSKIDELRVNTKVCCEYRESSVMVFTETWLHQDIPDSLIEFEGFSLIRVDRTDQSGKSRKTPLGDTGQTQQEVGHLQLCGQFFCRFYGSYFNKLLLQKIST